ncbi:TPA: glycosyltransferase [Photobacterium damselae]
MSKSFIDKKIILVNSLGLGGGEKIAVLLSKEMNLTILTLEKNIFYDCDNVICLSKLPVSFPKILHRIFSSVYFPFYVVYNKIELVQSHLLVSNLLNSFFSKILNYKSVIVQHGNISLLNERGWISKIIFHIYRYSNTLVCISDDMAVDAKNIIGHTNVVKINNPCVEIHLNKEEPDFYIKDDYFIVLGRLIKGKRISDVIKTFRLFEKYHLVIVGDGEEMLELRSEAIRYGILHRVHFIGQMYNPFSYLKKAQGLILASESEGFPNCLIESLSLGVPVITTDCRTGPSEILDSKLDLAEYKKTDFGYLYEVGNCEALEKILNEFNKEDFSETTLKNRASIFSIDNILPMYYNIMDIK